MWYVYILLCADDSFYVGHTQDIGLREKRHNEGRGAKYTARRRSVELLWQEPRQTEESAVKREKQIKGWSKAKKNALIEGDVETLRALAKCNTSSDRAFTKKRL